MVEDSLGARLFAETKSVEGFYLQVNMLHGDELKQKENTLIFMDEIQAYPHLLTLLKFLFQDNQFTYIAKGGEDNLSADLLCDALLRLWILPRGCAGENRLVAIKHLQPALQKKSIAYLLIISGTPHRIIPPYASLLLG